MVCPDCEKGGTKVIDSREDDQAIRRRRECLACQFRFTTFERIEVVHLIVVKRDGARQPFSKNKLLKGIELAGQKRPLVLEKIDLIANEIERELYRECKDEVKSIDIGKQVLKHLRDIDPIAYLRFASVHRSFDDVDSFQAELESIASTDKDQSLRFSR